MTIAPALLQEYPALNDAQRSIVGHSEGPLLVIAGPGSGKTLSLVLRAMNLLLLGGDVRLELLDFKTSPRPASSPDLLAIYERQLCTYAHILEKRHGKRVERLLLYWTAEPRKQDALMELPYRPTLVEEAGKHFDTVVGKIQARDFRVATPLRTVTQISNH